MTDDDAFELSRRKALAGLGTIGVASAGAGLGTSAFFSDTENFEGNSLTAGELDLKIDWSEHYSDWSDDEEEGIEVSMDGPSGAADYGLPEADPLIWVSDPEQFKENTAIEAYPDSDDDGRQDTNDAGEVLFPDGNSGTTTDICESPSDLNGALGSDYRTDSTDEGGLGGPPNPQVTDPSVPDSLIEIGDVKPGDFGEVTFSLHLCGNDGYIWLTSELVEALENGLTEPEAKDPDEFEGVVELLNEIRVALWYDFDDVFDENSDTDGDNLVDDGEEYILGGDGDVTLAEFLSLGGAGSMGIPLDGNPYGGDGGVELFCVDSSDEDAWDLTGDELLGAEGADNTVNVGPNDEITIQNVVTNDDGDPVGFDFVFDPDAGLGEGVCGFSIDGASGDTQDRGFDAGCIRDSVLILSNDGDPIERLGFDYCEFRQLEEGRQCFTASNDYYIGFDWWLPVDHANEIQTDSVEFNIGFYTEQCRHNDGTGMPPEETA